MSRKRDPKTTAVALLVQKAFGERLKRARKGMKQQTLAADLRITRTSVSNIERGRHRIFLDQVYVAAHSLGVSVEALLPSLLEVFPEQDVMFASDVPMSVDSAKLATEIAISVREQLSQPLFSRNNAKRRT